MPEEIPDLTSQSRLSSFQGSSVKSAARVLDVLEFFERTRSPCKATDICKEFGWPPSSTKELLDTLVHRGYLIFHEQEKFYFTSPRVAEVGAWIGKADSILAGALKVLEEVCQDTGESVALSIENNFSAQMTSISPGRTPLPICLPAGFRAPLATSAAGMAILSTKSDSDIIRILRRSRAPAAIGRGWPTEFLERVHRCKTEGYALILGRVFPESCWISMPIPMSYHQVAAAVSVGGYWPSMKGREAAISQKLRMAIQRYLG